MRLYRFYTEKSLTICIIELKNNPTKFNHIYEKFTNTTKNISAMLKMFEIKNYTVIPILVAKSFKQKPSFLPLLKKSRIKVNGKKHPIQHARCHSHISDLNVI